MGFFEKLKNGLKKTKDSMMGRIESLLHSFSKIDEDLFEELEETLILCDIGVTTSEKICDKLRQKVKQEGVKEPEKIKDMLKEIITEMLGEDQKLDMSTTPSVILVIGVNGVGKTTTIGKLAYQLHKQGKKVIVAAADTFRAAAIDQLEVWTERAGVDIIKHNEGSDPASVVFDALVAAKARQADVVICDTAGRLHNKKNLMDELKKISRIVHQQAEGCALEVLLALDATTGQNAVNQARQFNEVADITGIILTKLDGLFCVTLAITSPPAVSVSSSSSSRESSTSYEPVSTAASSTRSFFIVLSNISAILITPNVCYQAALRLFQA